MSVLANVRFIVVGVVIGVGIMGAVFWKSAFFVDRYAVVSFSSNSLTSSSNLMFGKIHRFPRLTLTDAFVVIKDKDGREQLVPLKIAPWAPKDGIVYLNNDIVTHWSYLDPASEIVQQMKSSLSQKSQQPNQSPQAQPQAQPQVPQSVNAPLPSPPKPVVR